jgi:hypothetical protein
MHKAQNAQLTGAVDPIKRLTLILYDLRFAKPAGFLKGSAVRPAYVRVRPTRAKLTIREVKDDDVWRGFGKCVRLVSGIGSHLPLSQ